MDKKIVEEEIERQKRELVNILISKMKEPERSNNICKRAKTILYLIKVLEKDNSDEKE